MVDYFALIAPTIESLAKSTVEERRQVYDRLIKMLEAQLRSADPPRSEIDILRERIDLEAAIRRVERRIQAGQISAGAPFNPESLQTVGEQIASATTAATSEPSKIKFPLPSASSGDVGLGEKQAEQPPSPSLSPPPPQLPQPDPLKPADISRLANPAQGETQALKTQRPAQQPAAANPQRPADWASLVPQPRPNDRAAVVPPVRSPVSSPVSGPSSQDAFPPGPPRRPPPPPDLPAGPPRRMQSGVSPSSGVPPRAQPLRGPATPSAEPDAGRPIYGARDTDPRLPASRLRNLPDAFRSMPGALTSQRAPSRSTEAQREYGILPPGLTGDLGRPVVPPPTSFRRPDAATPLGSTPPQSPIDPYRDPERVLRDEDYSDRSSSRDMNMDAQATDPARPTVSVGARPRASMLPTRSGGGWKRLAIISACIVAILGGIAMTAYLLRDDPEEFANANGKYAASEKPQAEEKISDRLPSQTPSQNVTPANPNAASNNGSQQTATAPQTSPSSPTPDANGVLTQKAMLLMEPADQSVPATTLSGRATWRLETLKSVMNTASEIGSRATIDIPEAGLTATFVFRRNRDPQSANSHMIEVGFVMSETNSTGKVRDIRVPELRSEETARGTPLSGIPVPVTENVFLVGLNALPIEMQKNLELLRSQNWFAMPLRFANGKRGILMFEKGKTGERVMEDAMQAWKAN